MKWLICAIPDEVQAKILEDRLRNIGPVLYTRGNWIGRRALVMRLRASMAFRWRLV